MDNLDRRHAKRFQRLQGGQKNYICPPRSTGMMTGTKYAYQSQDGSITLVYENDATETRPASIEIADFESYFHIVGYVQEARTV